MFYSIFGNLMARCVGRSPEEMVRELVVTEKSDMAKIGTVPI